MDQVLDAVIAQLNLIKDEDYDNGGFKNEIDVVGDVWFDDPGILPEESYPFLWVEPVTAVKSGETTANIDRDLTIRIGLAVDPRGYYDEAEVRETSASRELIRTIDAIRRHFERTSLRIGNGLGPGTKGVEVGSTNYLQQQRGDLYTRVTQLTLVVKKTYPRLP